MASEFQQVQVIAVGILANADKTSDAYGAPRFTKLSVVLTATDLNQADATYELQARHKGQAWVSISGPSAMTATAGAKNYVIENTNFLYHEVQLLYKKGTVSAGTIKASILFKS